MCFHADQLFRGHVSILHAELCCGSFYQCHANACASQKNEGVIQYFQPIKYHQF